MKKAVFGFLACVALAATGFAGTATYSAGKSYKEYKNVEKPTCFSDTEIQVDVFGAYVDGNSPNHAGPVKDHGWGGGVGLNYFFHRYFGVSAEGYWLDAKHNSSQSGIGADSNGTTFHSAGGNVIFRYPIDSLCLAPYVYAGGGATLDGKNWAVADVGVGLEYRLIPNKLGIFADERWNYYGDRFSHDTQNNFMTRAGVRWVF